LLKVRYYFLLCLSLSVNADIYDYIYPYPGPSFSNYGSLGLIQNPNARFLPAGVMAFSWSHNDPYLRGSIVAYPFNWLEASFQYTDVNNELYSEVPDFSGSQSLKDKSFDIKFRLLEESIIIPQVALGLRDLGGTGRFSSEYIVASKKIRSNLDISFGIGWANLNRNNIQNPLIQISDRFTEREQKADLGGNLNVDTFFSGDAGLFGGIEYSLPHLKGTKFKVELDGTNYLTESNPLRQDSRINYGFVYPVSNGLIVKLSYTRGNTLNFGFSYALDLGAKNPRNITKKPITKLPNSSIVQNITQKSDENIYKAALLYLSREGISLQKASVLEEELHVVYSQSKFRSPALSAGRTISILDHIAPKKIETIKVSEINAGMGMFSAKIDRRTLSRYRDLESPVALDRYLQTDPYIFKGQKHGFNPEVSYPISFFTISPDLVSQIGGPDGFFFGDLRLRSDSEILFSRNLSLITSVSAGLYDNMGDLKLASDSVLPHVRTDIVKYIKASRGLAIKRLQLNYYNQFTPSFFYKFSAGIFESMFSGLGAEFLYRPYHKNYGLGIDLWQVKQRDYDQMFSMRDYETLTGHLNFYYQDPSSNILFHLKGGKYLAKDSGFTFNISRVFRSSFRLGAFFSQTDISEAEFGEGSFDKGFYFWVPLDIFSQRHIKKTFGWGLRPVTRDGAQSLTYGYPLWGVTDPASDHRLRRRLSEFYE
jgi:hypothetical protein